MKIGVSKANIVRIESANVPTAVLDSYAACYCRIWREEPWSEDFWKPEGVIDDLRELMERHKAIVFFAVIDREVVGFTIGYAVDRDRLRSISGSDHLDDLTVKYDKIFYVAELGVDSMYRGRQISVMLTEALMISARDMGHDSFVLRTDVKAIVARHVYTKLGFTDLGIYDTAHQNRTYWFKECNLDVFKSKFIFDRNKSFHVGVERECFLTDLSGNIAPWSERVLGQLAGIDCGYELSACQLETRIGPCEVDDVMGNLLAAEKRIVGAEEEFGFRRLFTEVGPEDMPFDVYPDPTGRYQRIVETMPKHVLSAACRVIGTHIHVGMADHDTAMHVYNRVITSCNHLCELGNGSFGERLGLYRIMAPDYGPPPFRDWSDFYRLACQKGFADDPRKCWTLIRISKHGTIEFRMFGATASLERVATWARVCHDLCRKAV